MKFSLKLPEVKFKPMKWHRIAALLEKYWYQTTNSIDRMFDVFIGPSSASSSLDLQLFSLKKSQIFLTSMSICWAAY